MSDNENELGHHSRQAGFLHTYLEYARDGIRSAIGSIDQNLPGAAKAMLQDRLEIIEGALRQVEEAEARRRGVKSEAPEPQR